MNRHMAKAQPLTISVWQVTFPTLCYKIVVDNIESIDELPVNYIGYRPAPSTSRGGEQGQGSRLECEAQKFVFEDGTSPSPSPLSLAFWCSWKL